MKPSAVDLHDNYVALAISILADVTCNKSLVIVGLSCYQESNNYKEKYKNILKDKMK